MEAFDLTKLPDWLNVLAVVLTSVVSFLAARYTSKDKVQSQIVKQTVTRQQQLDERQNSMMDSLLDDIRRLRDELNMVREDLRVERERGTQMGDELDSLRAANMVLVEELGRVKEDNSNLSNELEKVKDVNRLLQEENTELKKQIELLKVVQERISNSCKEGARI